MDDQTSDVDPQKLLKSCPVKMKPINAFFKTTSTKLSHSKSAEENNTDLTENKNSNVQKDLNKEDAVDVEMSYEDFLKDKDLKHDTGSETENEKESSNAALRNGNSVCNGYTKLKDKSVDENGDNTMETGDKKTETSSENDQVIISNRSDASKDCNNTEQVDECPVVVKATGKASILGYFSKSSKVQDSKDKSEVSPDIIITKVDIHGEPEKKMEKKTETNSCEKDKVFSIFEVGKRKSGLEDKTSPKSNVSVHKDDFDMGITVLESPVVEETDEPTASEDVAMDTEELRTPDDTELSDGAEMSTESNVAAESGTSTTGTKTVKRNRTTPKSGNNGKSNNQKENQSKQLKKTPTTKTPTNKKKASKRYPLNSVDSSQSDDFTPKSKKTIDSSGSEKKRTLKYCGDCRGCRIEDDCGKCIMCLDKPKFGGPGIKKQKCIIRRCEKFFGPPKKDQKAKALLEKAKTKKMVTSPENKSKNGIKKSQLTKPGSKLSVKPVKGDKKSSSPTSKSSKTNTPSTTGRGKANQGSSESSARSKRRSAQAASKSLAEPSDVRAKRRKL